MRVRWLQRALQNLADEADAIARDDPRAAAKTVLRIEKAVALLADHPELGQTGRVPGTRELVAPGTPHLIPYDVSDRQVVILRVFHERRKWPPKF